jgi:hypothetical protein
VLNELGQLRSFHRAGVADELLGGQQAAKDTLPLAGLRPGRPGRRGPFVLVSFPLARARTVLTL